ncbi:prepilin-type N-terminal cleavage/methylation domain-containing protein [Aestuariibacter salexigens]|uniref:prepilin-type N-terminal cleavage/methylation domain-containing protein n=1 Tax=Aestuariibacter salexigens TaxID=226010 RepID=UPI00047EC830
MHLSQPLNARGFTLIEVVVVLALLGALAVFAASRFLGTAGFAEYAYQVRAVSALRAMQQRAMQDSRPSYCFQINFIPSASGNPAFGPPSVDYAPGNAAATCATSIDFSGPEYLRTDSDEMTGDDITLDIINGGNTNQTLIGFDTLGRPFTDEGACASGCRITISNELTATVCVESQGYIHAC